MIQPHVVGLDTGLTCTGLATAGRTSRTARIGQKSVTLLPLLLRTKAIVDIGANVVNQCYLSRGEAPDVPDRLRRPDLVVMEAPETSRAFGGLIERIQLYHEIARSLLSLAIPFAIVPSAILKGYATGNGGVDPKKKRVMAAVAELWPEYGKVNDDESDAIVLAAMGLDWLTGQRRVPDAQALDWLYRASIQWPARIGQVA